MRDLNVTEMSVKLKLMDRVFHSLLSRLKYYGIDIWRSRLFDRHFNLNVLHDNLKLTSLMVSANNSSYVSIFFLRFRSQDLHTMFRLTKADKKSVFASSSFYRSFAYRSFVIRSREWRSTNRIDHYRNPLLVNFPRYYRLLMPGPNDCRLAD